MLLNSFFVWLSENSFESYPTNIVSLKTNKRSSHKSQVDKFKNILHYSSFLLVVTSNRNYVPAVWIVYIVFHPFGLETFWLLSWIVCWDTSLLHTNYFQIFCVFIKCSVSFSRLFCELLRLLPASWREVLTKRGLIFHCSINCWDCFFSTSWKCSSLAFVDIDVVNNLAEREKKWKNISLINSSSTVVWEWKPEIGQEIAAIHFTSV